MKILNSKSKNFDKLLENLLLQRKNKIQSDSVSVTNIIKDVKKNGDKALLKYEKRFNQNNIIIPSSKQIKKSINSLDKKVKKAIDTAYNRIYKFHSLQKFKNISYTDKLKNKLEYKYLPLESVAIYVPGSTASYPSSVLMNAIPAIVAGVKRIVMINPGYKGKQNPAVLYAARKCKIKEIYSIGGPSAIAAAAYGTKKIKKVNKIVGPGNSYVTAAKKEVFGDVGIEGMIAGPSEITVVADKNTNLKEVLTSLIGQAEHDIVNAADYTMVVLVPESGDEVQLMKAGIIEIADIFIINKSDRPGAKRISRSLSDILHNNSKKDSIIPRVMNSTASIGEGISEVFEQMISDLKINSDNGILDKRRLYRYKNRIKNLIIKRLKNEFWTADREKLFSEITQSIDSIEIPPDNIVDRLISDFDH